MRRGSGGIAGRMPADPTDPSADPTDPPADPGDLVCVVLWSQVHMRVVVVVSCT